MAVAERVSAIQMENRVNFEDYAQSLKTGLIEVVYEWARGMVRISLLLWLGPSTTLEQSLMSILLFFHPQPALRKDHGLDWRSWRNHRPLHHSIGWDLSWGQRCSQSDRRCGSLHQDGRMSSFDSVSSKKGWRAERRRWTQRLTFLSTFFHLISRRDIVFAASLYF